MHITTLNGWNDPIRSPPDTDRLVCICRIASIGVGILKDLGYLKEGTWYSLVNDDAPLHEILGWQEFPELPKYEVKD